MNFPSKLIEEAVDQFSKLPGIGRKTALRLALNLLQMDKEQVNRFGQAFIDLRNNIKYCSDCHNISDLDVCEICSNPSRDESMLCVVEDIRDVMAIENTHQFKGKYHVFSFFWGFGVLVKEVIMALSTTMEGDTTNFYIFKKLKESNVKLSVIARGVSIGDELEYADEITLGRSIINRTPYENSIVK